MHPVSYAACFGACLTISLETRLRLPSESPQSETIADVEKCAGFLKDLEQRWSGAARSRAIIERLLADYCLEPVAADPQTIDLPAEYDSTVAMQGGNGAGTAGKRTFNEFDVELGDDDLYLNQVLGSELFAFENTDPGLMGPWGRL